MAVMLEDYVREMGCRFFQTTGTTDAALEAIETIVPDIVILDLTLAGTEPDFTLADQLATAGIPFIFCSGHNRSILPARHSTRPFLEKPFGTADIEDALGRCDLRRRPPAPQSSASGFSCK